MYDGTYRGLRKRELEKCLKKENSIILLVMDINGLIALKKEYKKRYNWCLYKYSKRKAKRVYGITWRHKKSIENRLQYYDTAKEEENEQICDYSILNAGTIEDMKNKFVKYIVSII